MQEGGRGNVTRNISTTGFTICRNPFYFIRWCTCEGRP